MKKFYLFGVMIALALSLGFVAQPSVNAYPQYGKIVFNSNRPGDGNTDIFIMNTNGTGLVNLTNNGATDYNAYPQISPDGSKIVFESNRDAGDNEIYIMNSDGSNQTRLTNSVGYDQKPAISPDGTKVAFQSNRDGNTEIYIMNSDGTGQTNISNNPSSDDTVAFSPDGTKVVFVSQRDGNGEIYSVNTDGSNTQRLTNNSDIDSDPAFSPDGNKIVFNSVRGGALNYSIYTMNSDGTNQVAITSTDGPGHHQPSYSPDGSAIVFTYSDSDNEIYTVNSDGTNMVNITNDPAGDFSPHFTGNTVPLNSYVNGSSNPQLLITSDFSAFDYNYQGTLTVNGQAGDVTVSSGSYVKGSGVVAILNVLSGGHLAPGQSPGCLTAGNTTLTGNFDVELGGTTACSGYDQLIVNGTIDVTGGTLNLSLFGGFTPAIGNSFTIINNDSNDPVTGTFSGLAQGSSVTIGGYSFTINYAGGDGNDVVLTTTAIPPTTPNTGAKPRANLLAGIVATVGVTSSIYFIARRPEHER